MEKIKVGLIGFGRAGKAVANVLSLNKDFDFIWVFKKRKFTMDPFSEKYGTTEFCSADKISINDLIINKKVDYIIDFSSSKNIYNYGECAADNNISIISAISHYSTQDQEFLHKLSEKTIVFWSPNITLGVNFLMASAKLLQSISPGVDIQIIEEHFKEKAETSGTAIKIAKLLNIGENSINSIRAGGIIGKHQVIFGFPHQTVRITHESISREAFGNGAIFAIKQLAKVKEKNGFFTFENILAPYFNN